MTNSSMPTFIITSQTEDGFIKYIYSSPDSQFINIANLIILPNAKLFKMLYDSFDIGFKFRLLIHPKMKDSGDIESGERIFHSLDDLSIGNIPFITRSLSIREKCKAEDKNYILKNDGYLYFDATRIDRDDFINDIPVYEKKGTSLESKIAVSSNIEKDKYDFGIITALFKDEFQKIQPLFDWDAEPIDTETKRYYTGHLKGNANKRIVATVQTNTGMIDASIIATEILELFKPKYLFMTGVCGGKDDDKLNFGDIVIAEKVFTFQKGKLSDIKDSEGNLVELFEIEYFPIEINTLIKDKIEPHLHKICQLIKNDLIQSTYNEDNVPKLNAVIAPMACSTMVINKDGYFENKIQILERKTVAVEMESYGIAKACKIANNGKTIPIIIKSIMDKTKEKDDRAKSFAAYTSANFLKYLIYNNILD